MEGKQMKNGNFRNRTLGIWERYLFASLMAFLMIMAFISCQYLEENETSKLPSAQANETPEGDEKNGKPPYNYKDLEALLEWER
jgi:hypothetical protein